MFCVWSLGGNDDTIKFCFFTDVLGATTRYQANISEENNALLASYKFRREFVVEDGTGECFAITCVFIVLFSTYGVPLSVFFFLQFCLAQWFLSFARVYLLPGFSRA